MLWQRQATAEKQVKVMVEAISETERVQRQQESGSRGGSTGGSEGGITDIKG